MFSRAFLVSKIDASKTGSYGLFVFCKSGVQITLKRLNALTVRSWLVGPAETELHEIQRGPVS